MAKKTGVVISNCQSLPLKHAISLYCKDVTFDYYGVHLLPPEGREEAVAAFVAEARRKYDIVLAIPLSPDFGLLSQDRVRETFSGQFFGMITNIYFAGLHPDLTYIGGLARRVEGPLGDYHSRLALLAYLKGLDVDQAIAAFCDETYQKMGYYDVYQASLNEISSREHEVDVPMAADLPALMRKDLCLFSVNHPTSMLFSHYAAKVARWLSDSDVATMSTWSGGPMGLVNHLASSSIFPIYPELAARFGLEYPGSYAFKPPLIGDDTVNPLDLESFVEQSFVMFEEHGRELLATTHQGRDALVQFGHALA